LNIGLVTIGSRGDVQLFVALGRSLQARGHTVTLNTHARFEVFIRQHGLGFHLLDGDTVRVMAKLGATSSEPIGSNLFVRSGRGSTNLARTLLETSAIPAGTPT
jgi:sterol 3beta-glucosyltransferase